MKKESKKKEDVQETDEYEHPSDKKRQKLANLRCEWTKQSHM